MNRVVAFVLTALLALTAPEISVAWLAHGINGTHPTGCSPSLDFSDATGCNLILAGH